MSKLLLLPKRQPALKALQNVSEQATTSAASSETTSETAQHMQVKAKAPTESAAGQTREALTTDRAANETASVPNETNVTGGQYYSDDQGNWYYKDASGKKPYWRPNH